MSEQVVTVVGPGTVIRGEVRCAGDLLVHGRIEGAVSCGGALQLEPGGVIEAEVRARSAVLAGKVRGDVSVIEAAELATSCRMLGDLRAARVAIAPGAAVRGRVELGDVSDDDDAVWGAAEDAQAGAFPEPPDVDETPGPATEEAPVAAAAAAEEPPANVEAPAAVPPPEVAPPQERSDAAPAAAARPPPPPPLPASALALGARSAVVLKR